MGFHMPPFVRPSNDLERSNQPITYFGVDFLEETANFLEESLGHVTLKMSVRSL